MPTITHTDYLAQVSGNGLVALPGLWVRLRNNSTSTDYFSTAVSDATGAFTHSAVPGDYSAYTGTAATVVGTPTLRNAHYAVPVTAGDDAVLGSATLVVSSPYAANLPGNSAVATPGGVTTGQLWDYGGFGWHAKAFGCKGDGVTDDSVNLGLWKTQLKAAGGAGILGNGNFIFTSLLDFSGPNTVSLFGTGREKSILTYTGGNIPIALNMGSTYNGLHNIQVAYTNSAFTSTLVSVAGSVAEPCIEGCLLWGNGASTAQYLLDVTLATTVTIRDTQFTNAQYAILGTKTDGTNPCDGARIENAYFGGGLTVAHIRNPGNGWDIQADCENLANGKGAHIVMDAAVSSQGVSLHGMWMGDATDVGLWTWIQIQGYGWSTTGSFIHGTGANASHAFDVIGTSGGINIAGNQIDHHAVGVALGASIATGVNIVGNSWANTTAATSGTALAPYYIQGNAAAGGGLALLTNTGISFAAEGPALDRVSANLRLNAGGAASYVAVAGGGFLRLQQTPSEAVLVSGVNGSSGDLIEVTLTAARLVGAPITPNTGQRLTFTFIQGGAGAFAVTWNAIFKGITWSNTGNATGNRSSISFVYDGTNWNQDGAQSPWAA